MLKIRSAIEPIGQRPWPTLDFQVFGSPDKPAQQTSRLLSKQAAGQLKKLDTAVANSGDADVARF